MRCTVAAGLFAISALPAQGAVLDVFDGETLYDGGLLLTLGQEIERRDQLKTGDDRKADPLDQHEQFLRTVLALQYGLRHDLQLGIALPWVRNERSSSAGDLVGEGVGDIGLLAKYRFLRLDGPGFATNFAVLAGLSLPTGDDDQHDGGAELEPDLQPGTGGFDPTLGVAVTHEPGRWRFNAAARYAQRTDTDGDGDRLGDEFVAELAAGNRFWLEPYPGPFMRLDLVARFHWHDQDRQDGPLPDSGGERWTAGVNWAFRPRPELDFQVYLELPAYEHLHGTQLGGGWLLDLTFGCRF
jgi:hypothetical protein